MVYSPINFLINNQQEPRILIEIESKLPRLFHGFIPLILLIPQLTITTTFIGLFIIILILNPNDIILTVPFLSFLSFYWIKKFKLWRDGQ